MSVIARFCGITMRLVLDRTFGTHVHAFYGDSELVIGLNPLKVIQGEAPSWVRDWVLEWVGHHQRELLLGHRVDPHLATPFSRQVVNQIGSEASAKTF